MTEARREGSVRATLRFPPESRRVSPSIWARAAAFGLLAVTAVSTGYLAVSRALSGEPVNGFGGLWGFVFVFGVICFLASVLAFMVLLVRGFRVADGVMVLPGPVRGRNGRPIWRVRLEDIVSAERGGDSAAAHEVAILLRDGTKFYISDGNLPRGGKAFLDELVRVVHEDARGGVATPLRPPST